MLSVLREEGPFRVHVEAGLANGLTRAQISEVVMHSAVYAGVPQALRSMRICREVFERLDAEAAAEPAGAD
jgi:alkylhydroperoxidase/carboxymuconolactone decarboxylase family protein YurZ